jgi:NAD(P)-dependent dehydrogenase (short-subunit alcohol dehydrogenase family)
MSEGDVLITGASSGIGEALTYRLAKRGGYTLVITGRSPERLAQVASTAEGLGASIRAIPGDLRDGAFLQELLALVERSPALCAIVNCAGIGRFEATSRFSLDDWNNILEVNLRVPFQLTQAAARRNHSDAVFTLVNVSSDADTHGFPEAAAYCASKSAILGMSRALQAELRSQNIRVCVVSPGRVDTRFNNRSPGDRPGALAADEVAEVIEFALICSRNLELTEIRLDSLQRS